MTRRTKRFFTLTEAREMIEDDNYDIRNFVIIPPENEGDVTDEDEEDELFWTS